MRNMLAFFAALLLTVAGAGWYLGWYTVRSTPAANGQRSVTVDINTVKVGEDLRAAGEKIQQRLAERSQKPAEPVKESKAGPKPWFELPEVTVPSPDEPAPDARPIPPE